MDLKEKFSKKKHPLKWFQERIGCWYWNTALQSSGTILDVEHANELYSKQATTRYRYSDYRP